MRSERDRLLAAVERLASVDGLRMSPVALAEDLRRMLAVYGDGFEVALGSLVRAVEDVIAGRVQVSTLKYGLSGVSSYHFQSVVAQGSRADMRLAFRRVEGGIEVLAFGSRHLPSDFYAHASLRTRGKDGA